MIQPGAMVQVEVPASIRLTNEQGVQIENKTIEVVTSDEISLYGVNTAYFRWLTLSLLCILYSVLYIVYCI